MDSNIVLKEVLFDETFHHRGTAETIHAVLGNLSLTNIPVMDSFHVTLDTSAALSVNPVWARSVSNDLGNQSAFGLQLDVQLVRCLVQRSIAFFILLALVLLLTDRFIYFFMIVIAFL
mgnify:CR=1 FL=1